MSSARTAASSKGKQRTGAILKAAERVLVRHGYHNFTMRAVAAAAQVSVGNLQYYYPTKNSLTKALLEHVALDYTRRLDGPRLHATPEPSEQLRLFLSDMLGDLNRERTTRLFPEIWALANHSRFAAKLTEEMYEVIRPVLARIIHAINPRLSAERVRLLSQFIVASLEGHTIFIGHGKPWIGETRTFAQMAYSAFMRLICEDEADRSGS